MIVAIDTGGTKTLIALFDDAGKVVDKIKLPTPRDQSEYLELIIRETRRLLGDTLPEAISIALPGVIRGQVAIVCKNLDWHDFDVLSTLRQYWPETPMYLENDANLGGVGAANLLSPAPKRCLYVTISTGIGGGFTTDGHIVDEISENEISDIHFEYNGQMTRWGAIANGRAIMDDFGVYASDVIKPEDQQEVGRRISRGLLALLPVLRPDVVAFGGGAGAHYELFRQYVEAELAILPSQYHCEIITAPHPEEIVIYGCYYHAKHRLDS